MSKQITGNQGIISIAEPKSNEKLFLVLTGISFAILLGLLQIKPSDFDIPLYISLSCVIIVIPTGIIIGYPLEFDGNKTIVGNSMKEIERFSSFHYISSIIIKLFTSISIISIVFHFSIVFGIAMLIIGFIMIVLSYIFMPSKVE